MKKRMLSIFILGVFLLGGCTELYSEGVYTRSDYCLEHHGLIDYEYEMGGLGGDDTDFYCVLDNRNNAEDIRYFVYDYDYRSTKIEREYSYDMIVLNSQGDKNG